MSRRLRGIDSGVGDSELSGISGRMYVRMPDSYSTGEGVHKFGMLVWDADSLAWVKFTGNDPTAVASNVYITNTPSVAQSGAPWSMDGRRALEIKYAPINTTTIGSSVLIPADATKKIKVCHYTFVVEGTVAVSFRSGSTALTGAMPFSNEGGASTPIGSPSTGWLFETAVGEALNLNLSAAVGVRGHLTYFLES